MSTLQAVDGLNAAWKNASLIALTLKTVRWMLQNNQEGSSDTEVMICP
jgi:hypothetical protein